MLVPDAVRLQPGERLRGIGLALRREPEHNRVVEDRRARGVGEVFPILERVARHPQIKRVGRSEEHKSELHSLMRISYAVFCLKKKNHTVTCTGECINSHKHLSTQLNC